MISSAGQINRHAPITNDTVMFMINFVNLCQNLGFLGIIICLPVFPVVIIRIRANIQSPEQPTDTEFFLMLINKPISL